MEEDLELVGRMWDFAPIGEEFDEDELEMAELELRGAGFEELGELENLEEEEEEEDFNPVSVSLSRPKGVSVSLIKYGGFEKAYLAKREREEVITAVKSLTPLSRDSIAITECTECKTLSWNGEIGVCHNCNYRSVAPQRSFYEDKMKYLRTLLNKKNNWRATNSRSYENDLDQYPLNPSDAKQVLVIFSSLLNFLSIQGYTKVTLNYNYILKLIYGHLRINKHIDEPRISKKKKFWDGMWLDFLPFLKHVLDDKRKREEWRRGVIKVINDNAASEILRQQEWESGY